MSTVITAPRTLATDRAFYTGMALLCAATVVIGFSPTFYLRATPLPPLSPLLVIHGVVYTAWFALFITQAALIAANRRGTHRVLGGFGAALAVAMVVLGTLAAIDALRRGAVPVKGLDPRTFFAIPMRDMVTFPLLVGAAVWFRRHPETHKRLMLLATIGILDAAFGRFPLEAVATYGPPAFYALVDALIIVGMTYDRVTRGRVHPAYWWGGGLIVGSQVLFLAIGGTAAWMSFAGRFL